MELFQWEGGIVATGKIQNIFCCISLKGREIGRGKVIMIIRREGKGIAIPMLN
jgi:hypothetical protein